MRLINFTCRNLNSFLTREINFFPDVSFLHGINGSGKTTILRAIASLLTPDPLWLVNATYDYVAVDLDHESQRLRIASLKNENGVVTVTISGFVELQDSVGSDEIRFLSRMGDEDYVRLHDPDDLVERSRLVIQKLKTLEFISSIPTPIFLGLDRTTLTPSAVARAPRSSRARAVHPYFRTQLDDAIVEAERLLARQLSVLSNERNKIFENLRNRFVLSLFSAPNPNITLPKLLELADQFETKKISVEYALERIGVQTPEINSTVEPFFEEIRRGAIESSPSYSSNIP
jgi:hypothetical protein